MHDLLNDHIMPLRRYALALRVCSQTGRAGRC
jgi:hypothetical protein